MSTKIKVLFVFSSFERTGPNNQLYNLVSTLSDRVHFKLICLKDVTENSMIESFSNLNVDIKSLHNKSFIEKIKFLRSEHKHGDWDVFQSHGIKADFFSSLIFRDKNITTLRNYPLDDYPMQYGIFLGYSMAFFHYIVLLFISKRVAVSRSSYLLNYKVSRLEFEIINNGVDVYKFKPSDTINTNELFYSKPSFCPDKITFIYTGPLIARKNVTSLIKAFNELKQFQLIILGDGPSRHELESLSENSNIFFMGTVESVTDFLSLSDCFIMSSFSEGYPNSVLEAVSCGLPCILSNITPHVEVKDLLSDVVEVFTTDSEMYEYILLTEKLSTDKRNLIRNEAVYNLSSQSTSDKYYKLYTEMN